VHQRKKHKFRICIEKDDIVLVFPLTANRLFGDRLFFTKVHNRWVSDCRNHPLSAELIAAIEACLPQQIHGRRVS
jgi:hypothetical protein